MGTEDFPCPKCSQLNTIGQTTCKNCGVDLEQVMDGSKHKEKATGARPTLILGIIAIIILGVMAFYILVMFPNSSHKQYRMTISPRSLGGAISGTISSLHANYLLNGIDYTLDDVLSSTYFSGGIKYQPTDTDTPASGEIASNAAGNAIIFNFFSMYHNKQATCKWDYIPRNGDTPAYITENADSDF